MLLGMGLAIFLDQKIRFEGVLRTSVPDGAVFIVTGTTWKWILNPRPGLGKTGIP